MLSMEKTQENWRNSVPASGAAAAVNEEVPRAILVSSLPTTSSAAVGSIPTAATGEAAVGSRPQSDCCHPCGTQQRCCTALKAVCWVAMVFFFLQAVLSIPIFFADWSTITFNDEDVDDENLEEVAFLMLWGIHLCAGPDSHNDDDWKCTSDHWHRLEKGDSDVSEQKINRPSHQPFAAATTTLGLIFGIIGFVIAIVTSCVSSNNRSCMTCSFVLMMGCLLVAVMQIAAGGQWSSDIDDWKYTKLVEEEYPNVYVDHCSSGCGLSISAGTFGMAASLLVIAYTAVAFYQH